MEKLELWLDNIQQAVLLFLVKIGSFSVSLLPAYLLGHSVSQSYGLVAGIIAALSMEVASIILVYSAVQTFTYWRKKVADKRKLNILLWLTPLNALLMSLTIAFNSVWLLAVLAPFVTIAVYAAITIGQDNRHLLAERQQSQPSASTKPAKCQHCQKEFGTQAALNAHRRFCKRGDDGTTK